MRVAIFHNRYTFRGGEDTVVEQELRLLEEAGVDVFFCEVDNKDVFGRPGPKAAHALLCSNDNGRSARMVRRFLRDHRIDIGHVHNWFPLFSPSIHRAHREVGVPVVQTLHNYRLGCGGATLMRDGKFCNSCLDGDRTPAIEHGCYRGSGLLTRMWARVITDGWRSGRFVDDVSLYLSPSSYVRDVHVDLGLPADKVQVLSHGVPEPGLDDVKPPTKLDGALFAGRFSDEKGVPVLLEAWEQVDYPLTIIGDGPHRPLVEAAAEKHPHIEYIGKRSHDEVLAAMAKSAVVISPHLGPETFGLVVVEAMATGRPVVASHIGGAAEIITHGHDGLLFRPGDPSALRRAVGDATACDGTLARMGAKARGTYEERYTEPIHVAKLLAVFEALVGEESEQVPARAAA